jgi:hypothetical protein
MAAGGLAPARSSFIVYGVRVEPAMRTWKPEMTVPNTSPNSNEKWAMSRKRRLYMLAVLLFYILSVASLVSGLYLFRHDERVRSGPRCVVCRDRATRRAEEGLEPPPGLRVDRGEPLRLPGVEPLRREVMLKSVWLCDVHAPPQFVEYPLRRVDGAISGERPNVTVSFWGGLALLVLGAFLAWLAITSTLKKRRGARLWREET